MPALGVDVDGQRKRIKVRKDSRYIFLSMFFANQRYNSWNHFPFRKLNIAKYAPFLSKAL